MKGYNKYDRDYLQAVFHVTMGWATCCTWDCKSGNHSQDGMSGLDL